MHRYDCKIDENASYKVLLVSISSKMPFFSQLISLILLHMYFFRSVNDMVHKVQNRLRYNKNNNNSKCIRSSVRISLVNNDISHFNMKYLNEIKTNESADPYHTDEFQNRRQFNSSSIFIFLPLRMLKIKSLKTLNLFN